MHHTESKRASGAMLLVAFAVLAPARSALAAPLKVANGFYSLLHEPSGQALTIDGNQDGAVAYAGPYAGGEAQRFYLRGWKEGRVVISARTDEWKVLSSNASWASDPVRTWVWMTSPDQLWNLEDAGNGRVRIRHHEKKLFLNLQGSKPVLGTAGDLWRLQRLAGDETGFRVMVNGLQVNTTASGDTDQVWVELYTDGATTPTKQTPKQEMNTKTEKGKQRKRYWIRPASVYAESSVKVRVLNQSGLMGEVTLRKTDADSSYIAHKLTAHGDYELALSKLTRRNLDPRYVGVNASRALRVPTLDQGNVGACVAFATVAALSDAYLMTVDRGGSSQKELFDPLALYARRLTPAFKAQREQEADDTRAAACSASQPCVKKDTVCGPRGRCVDYEGWRVELALEEILRNGIPFKDDPTRRLFLKSFERIQANGRTQATVKQGDQVVTRVHPPLTQPTTTSGHDLMRNRLMRGQPLLVTYFVFKDFDSYTSEYAIYGGRVSPDDQRGGHAVVMTGFSTPLPGDHDYPYWMMQNSWGTQWGANGKLIFAENAVQFDDEAFALGGFEVVGDSTAPRPPVDRNVYLKSLGGSLYLHALGARRTARSRPCTRARRPPTTPTASGASKPRPRGRAPTT